MALAFPNVCLVPAPPAPPIPVPFPSIAQIASATGSSCTSIVKIENKVVLHKMSEIPSSNGDEAGTNKGVMSGTTSDKVVFRTAISKVKVEGNDIVTVLSATAHNGSNPNAPAGAQLAPSQAKVIVVP